MNRRTVIRNLGLSAAGAMLGRGFRGSAAGLHEGPFLPGWNSLAAYTTPEWFRDAKFGMWAHWGPQCQPEAGDWYARGMYVEGSPQYKIHLQKYGHPSVFDGDQQRADAGDRWIPDFPADRRRAGDPFSRAAPRPGLCAGARDSVNA